MSVEVAVPGGQLMRLHAGGVHVSRWTTYRPYVADGAAFERLKASIQFMSGNVQPIGVRRTGRWPDGCTGTHELIFGHLRLQACQELGIPVLAVFEEIGDRELLVHFTAEHQDKIEAFPWRFGTACQRALQEGLYPSARKLWEALDVPIADLVLAMKLAQLPIPIQQLFHRVDMSWSVSRRLVDRYERDPEGTLRAAERAERLVAVSALHAFRKAFPDGLPG